MKDKYNDNKLAEEFDLIVLTDDTQTANGLPKGSLGFLTYAYTGMKKPLYGEFSCADGTKRETPLSLSSFRVLNVKNCHDLALITAYLRRKGRKNA